MTGSAALRRAASIGRVAIAIEFVVALAIVVYAGLRNYRDVFNGAPSAVPARIVSASCTPSGADGNCHASAQELTPGRYRIATDIAAGALTIDLATDYSERAHSLLVRVSQPAKVRLVVRSPSQATPDALDVTDEARIVSSLPGVPSIALSFEADPKATPGRIVLDELGVFERGDGLLTDTRRFFPAIPPARYATLVLRFVAALCLFTIVASVFLPPAPLRRYAPFVLIVVCFSLCLLDLAALFSPYVGHDLRTFYASGPLEEPAGANLNGGLHLGFRLLEGKGLTLRDGLVPWERMPGYGLFCAAAGILFGHRTLLDLAMSVVLLQTVFYSVAVGVFAAAAMHVLRPPAAWAVGLVVAWLPKQLAFTQADAIIAPVALLMLAALAIRLRRTGQGQPVPLAVDVLVHASFALWLLMRPDVLPGWAIVSLALHWRQWRRLVIPVTLFLIVGGGWGAYKARYTGEFALTTSSGGASLFCGLWEVPSRFRYAMACTDETYFDWIHQHTPFQPQSAAANSFATREVLRFWLTYPGHVFVMLCDKMMQVLNGDLWPGYVTPLQVAWFNVVPRYAIVMSLLTVIAACVVLDYERARTLLLGWPLLLDAPLFFVMFASLGRFYAAVGVALVAASVPPLFEPAFYTVLWANKRRTAALLACAVLIAATAWPLHAWLLRNDALHYWTPLLDPAGSRLSELK